MNRYMLLIDCQNDFCGTTGSLYVKGASVDMYNLAQLVDRVGESIERIVVTLDNHRVMHIAHPLFWIDKNNEHPKPYTPITLEDVENGVWRASVGGFYQTIALDYVRTLKAKGKTNFIWPEHAIINTTGAAIYPIISDALLRWERKYHTVDYLEKGMAIRTEMFGAFESEVPDIHDPSTQMNMDAISKFVSADEILIAGEALSHCVAETVKQLAKYVCPSKFVLLSDCTSNVPNFEFLGDAFVKELTEKGMRVAKSTEVV